MVTPDSSPPVFIDPPNHILVEEGYTGQSFKWTATDAHPATYTVEYVGSGIVAGPISWSSSVEVTYNIPDGFSAGAHWYNITITDISGRFASIIVTFNVTEAPPEPPSPKIPLGNTFLVYSGILIIGLMVLTIKRMKKTKTG